jgi:hypothetical protein
MSALHRPARAAAGGHTARALDTGDEPPAAYEYRIRRDASGAPLRDASHRPIVEFGPEQHCSPTEWTALAAFWAALRTADEVPGLSPIF